MKKSQLFTGNHTVLNTVKFHDATYYRPEKSGVYLCVTEAGNIMLLPYSRLWNSFNVRDRDYNERNSIQIFAWSELPELVAEYEYHFSDDDFEDFSDDDFEDFSDNSAWDEDEDFDPDFLGDIISEDFRIDLDAV